MMSIDSEYIKGLDGNKRCILKECHFTESSLSAAAIKLLKTKGHEEACIKEQMAFDEMWAYSDIPEDMRDEKVLDSLRKTVDDRDNDFYELEGYKKNSIRFDKLEEKTWDIMMLAAKHLTTSEYAMIFGFDSAQEV